jgi:hypothetical protein
MDYYETWFNLKNTAKDLEFTEKVQAFLGHVKEKGMIEGYRLTRRKLGFGPPGLGEFHITIEVKDLAQLDQAFLHAATRAPDVEPLHAAVYGAIEDVTFALYRDFPDSVRHGLKDEGKGQR